MENKKAQEEIIGFVLIVLLVSVIAVVFLAISLRKPVEKMPSKEVESFLYSSMQVSSDCFISQERVYNFKDLIASCSETNERCLNGKSACEVLNETAVRILKENWGICEDCPTKFYKLSVYDDRNRTVYSLKEGNCSGNKVYSPLAVHTYSGRVNVELEICK